MGANDTWQPDQYRRFQAERDQPFLDLLSLVDGDGAAGGDLVDLGCGDGRLTAVAHQHLGTDSALGIDSSPAMLADSPTVDGLTFDQGDLATFERAAAYDVVLANASLHWVPDHEAVLGRWVRSLRPGGQLAVQVPANADHPSHTVLAAVTEELGIEEMVGIDYSDAMLTAARESVGCNDDRLRFARGDVGKWTGRGDHDLVIANASMHWVPDHPEVLARWWAALTPGGQLAVQVPANADHPAHRIASQVAATEPFLAAFNSLPPPDPVAQNVLPPEQYATVLDELGATEQHVRLQVYAHRLETSAEVVEWVKGTTLTRVRKVTDDAAYDAFLERYRTALLDVIGDQAPYTYLFKRILLRARF